MNINEKTSKEEVLNFLTRKSDREEKKIVTMTCN